MLKRKIEDTLIQWKNTPNHKPLVIMGIRQFGNFVRAVLIHE